MMKSMLSGPPSVAWVSVAFSDINSAYVNSSSPLDTSFQMLTPAPIRPAEMQRLPSGAYIETP